VEWQDAMIRNQFDCMQVFLMCKHSSERGRESCSCVL